VALAPHPARASAIVNTAARPITEHKANKPPTERRQPGVLENSLRARRFTHR
jgi:hypothetical protein